MGEMDKIDESQRYDKSNMPNGAQKGDDSQITADSRGRLVYPSMAAAGLGELVLPAAHGPNAEERMLVRDFGSRVVQEIERSLQPNRYPKSSPRKSASETFWHYVGAAKGASLMDEGGLKRMEGLAKEFEQTAYPQEFFEQVLAPYLHELKPKRR